MQTVSCPSCGAEVTFRSHAAVMAVCEYCHTRVLKEADAVKDLGKISAVLEDYSPIQVGTSGVFGERRFDVVGRIQLRYEAGMWNEWFIVFEDGGSGWLGDASGQYMVTQARPAEANVPAFADIVAGKPYAIGAERYTAADVREARCIGGQGELPFRVGDGWQARVADFRRGAQFLTLDYSEPGAPQVFTGLAVTLEGMQCQLLRDPEEIRRSAGRYRGQLDSLECPNCGTQIRYLPGLTASLVCQSCSSQIDAASPQASVIAAGERQERVRLTLQLGASGKLGAQDFTVIGAMRRADDEGSAWTEYLLYGSRSGFTWLVETEDGWSRANTMDEWPEWRAGNASTATLDKAEFSRLYEYPAVVTYAAGAFNWRVSVGDRCRVIEYKRQQVVLAAELTAQEMTWSRSTPVAWDQLKAWFGANVRDEGRPAARGKADDGRHRNRDTARNFIMAMAALNAIPLLANFGGTLGFTILGGLALYLPALLLDALNDQHKK